MSDYEENRKNVASLGCGTLILIALIVLFLSGGDTTQLENEVASLRQEVEALRAEQAETHRLIETLVLNAGSGPALPQGVTPDAVIRKAFKDANFWGPRVGGVGDRPLTAAAGSRATPRPRTHRAPRRPSA
jgi:hypothetical protein